MGKKSDIFGLLAFLHWNHDWNNWHFPDDLVRKAAAQIKELGVSVVRTDILWSDIHRGPDQYDFSRYDKRISLLTDFGLQLLVLLHYNKVRTNQKGKAVWARPPDSFEEFARYVGATVSHFKNRVHHWEIWNEPNHPRYWALPPDGLKAYTQLLRVSYQAAKEADPASTVLNGGITGDVVADVRNFYLNGGKVITDTLSIHTFLDPLSPSTESRFDTIVDGVRKIMIANNDQNKKIWVTEMGCPGVRPSEPSKDWWLGKNPTEAEQADWLEKQYAMVRKYPFVEKLFWAFYRDTTGFFKDGTDHLGLVRFDLSPKPAFHRMKKMLHS